MNNNIYKKEPSHLVSPSPFPLLVACNIKGVIIAIGLNLLGIEIEGFYFPYFLPISLFSLLLALFLWKISLSINYFYRASERAKYLILITFLLLLLSEIALFISIYWSFIITLNNEILENNFVLHIPTYLKPIFLHIYIYYCICDGKVWISYYTIILLIVTFLLLIVWSFLIIYLFIKKQEKHFIRDQLYNLYALLALILLIGIIVLIYNWFLTTIIPLIPTWHIKS